MTLQTNSQRMAQSAYQRVAQRKPTKEFTSFAREFPTLVHSCGLAQAVAFSLAKGGHQEHYVSDLAAVLQAAGYAAITSNDQLAEVTRTASVATYLRLSRDALLAAVWLKRHVEASEEQAAPLGGK